MASKSHLSLLAIVIVGIVIAGNIGSYLLTSQTPQTAQMTTTQSVTSKPTVFFKLFGKIFFDYNGNGKQDRGESDLSDVVVALDGKNATSTNSTGWYVIDRVVEGNHTIRPYPPKNFRYMCESVAEFRSVQAFYEVFGRNDTRKDIGLMEGFLTSPVERISIGRYYDWDSRAGYVKLWNGKQYPYTNPTQGGWDDDHTGTDFDATYGTPVYAAAPGVVVHAALSGAQEIAQGDLSVDISHDNGFYTDYHHFSKILVSPNQRVKRGEIIGLVGSSGTFYPHVHFEIYTSSNTIYDPFKPIFPVDEKSSGYWWATPTSKHWVSLPLATNPNVLGYWTKADEPIPPE